MAKKAPRQAASKRKSKTTNPKKTGKGKKQEQETKMVIALERKEVYTADEAALILGINARLVRHYCAQGRLGRRIGARVFLITHEELEEFAKEPRIVGNPGRGMFRRGPNREISTAEAVKLINLVKPGDQHNEIHITERDIEITRRRATGESLQALADHYSLSRERIRQVTSLVAEAAEAKWELKQGRVKGKK